MAELAKSAPESDKSAIAHAANLLIHYSFDLSNCPVGQLLDNWLIDYSAAWIRLAVIEALYQGRYKAVSVDQILALWKRRQQPCQHFSYEFERLVCHNFPRNLSDRSPASVSPSLEPAVEPLMPEDSPIPAWVELAEQIRSETEPEPDLIADAAIAPPEPRVDLNGSTAAVDVPTHQPIQASVEALIDQAASTLQTSTEAIKLRFLTEKVSPQARLMAEESNPVADSAAAAIVPADFHAKLKAVAEVQEDELTN